MTQSEITIIRNESNKIGGKSGVNPETLVIMKEREYDTDNPCIGCAHEYSNDAAIQDYCHYHCKR